MQTARPEELGRMYTATREEAMQNTTFIKGTLLIHLLPAVVLFDSGSTHTFIARTFADMVGLTPKA